LEFVEEHDDEDDEDDEHEEDGVYVSILDYSFISFFFKLFLG
jgi:hypothetical protein